MVTLNDYGGPDPNVDEGIGDLVYEKIEDKAKDAAKDGAGKAVDASVKALDKATDHIKPVKDIKDKVKEKLANNPITRAKAAINRAKEKIKQAANKLAKEGVKAVGRAAVSAVKGIASFAAANPVAAVVIVIVIIVIVIIVHNTNIDLEDVTSNLQNDNILLDNPTYENVDGMVDDDVVVVLMGDCVEQQYDSMGKLDATKEELAMSIYSVFHAYGFNNASIAGILGNLDIESGLDPSSIEGIMSEYGFLGDRKAQALLSLTNYTENILFPMYKKEGKSVYRDGYKVINDDGDTVYYCGLGLAQWTAVDCYTFMKTAETLKTDWYDMDFQLGYMISDCMYRPGFFSGWVGNQEVGDDEHEETWVKAARDSAITFAHDYEGNKSNDGDRADAAEKWYYIIKDWDGAANQEYADSIMALATELGGIINFIDVENAQYRCLEGNVFDNSSLATAAISFAWPSREKSFNNGTNLYQTVHDSIFPKDFIYKACDRTVACAVRWSGTDDQYPIGSTATQLMYLESSPKWEKIGQSSSVSIGDLQPGDIFCLNGHTFIFTGESAIQAAYMNDAKTGSDSVSGSLNERSPACDSSTTSIINRGGQDWNGRGVYNVYRCINPDNSTTYSSIGAGMSD